MSEAPCAVLRLALPKGRMEGAVLQLLADAGLRVVPGARSYRPVLPLPGLEAKTLKPQNVVEMLALGRRDLGFAGGDWVEEFAAEFTADRFGSPPVLLLDTGLDPVRIVAAAPPALLENGRLPRRRLVVCSEYETLTRAWIDREGLDATFARSYGATEVFPPEDADLIVDNTATGATLSANGLVIVDTLLESSTRLYASRAAYDDPPRRRRIEDLVLLLASVLEARRRVMLEVNAPRERLRDVVALLPCMREATVAPLYGDAGFAIKAAVPRATLPQLIPAVRAAGGTDLVITSPSQIVP